MHEGRSHLGTWRQLADAGRLRAAITMETPVETVFVAVMTIVSVVSAARHLPSKSRHRRISQPGGCNDSQTAPRKHRLLCVGHCPDREILHRNARPRSYAHGGCSARSGFPASSTGACRSSSSRWRGVRGNTPAIVFDIVEGGIDDVVAGLVAKGVTIVTPVSEAPGGWSADFLDPDGFGVGLYQSGEKPRSLKQ